MFHGCSSVNLMHNYVRNSVTLSKQLRNAFQNVSFHSSNMVWPFRCKHYLTHNSTQLLCLSQCEGWGGTGPYRRQEGGIYEDIFLMVLFCKKLQKLQK